MGTWGPGIFENDSAGDSVTEVLQQLENTVEAILADEQRSRIDEDGEGVLMPYVKLIYIICKHTGHPTLPESVVKRWRDQYLAIYDGQIDKLGSAAGYKDARRIV